jgi:hypothetical protein
MQSTRRIIAALCLIWLNSAAAIGADAVTRIDTYGDWSLLADTNAPHLFCFVTSEPKTSEPQDAARDAPRAYISAWPKDGIRGEISFRMGIEIKKNAGGTATVKRDKYNLFAADDRVFVKDPTQELKLLDAMRKGNSLTIAVASEDGTTVTDTYSLSGVGAALQKLQDACF